jgi:hypothetical protein
MTAEGVYNYLRQWGHTEADAAERAGLDMNDALDIEGRASTSGRAEEDLPWAEELAAISAQAARRDPMQHSYDVGAHGMDTADVLHVPFPCPDCGRSPNDHMMFKHPDTGEDALWPGPVTKAWKEVGLSWGYEAVR